MSDEFFQNHHGLPPPDNAPHPVVKRIVRRVIRKAPAGADLSGETPDSDNNNTTTIPNLTMGDISTIDPPTSLDNHLQDTNNQIDFGTIPPPQIIKKIVRVKKPTASLTTDGAPPSSIPVNKTDTSHILTEFDNDNIMGGSDPTPDVVVPTKIKKPRVTKAMKTVVADGIDPPIEMIDGEKVAKVKKTVTKKDKVEKAAEKAAEKAEKVTKKRTTTTVSKRSTTFGNRSRGGGGPLLLAMSKIDTINHYEKLSRQYNTTSFNLDDAICLTPSRGDQPLNLLNIAPPPLQSAAMNQITHGQRTLTKQQRNHYSSLITMALDTIYSAMKIHPRISSITIGQEYISPNQNITPVLPKINPTVSNHLNSLRTFSHLPLFYTAFIYKIFQFYSPRSQMDSLRSQLLITNTTNFIPIRVNQSLAKTTIPLPSHPVQPNSSDLGSLSITNQPIKPKTVSLYQRKGLKSDENLNQSTNINQTNPKDGNTIRIYQRTHSQPVIPIQHQTYHWYKRWDMLLVLQTDFDRVMEWKHQHNLYSALDIPTNQFNQVDLNHSYYNNPNPYPSHNINPSQKHSIPHQQDHSHAPLIFGSAPKLDSALQSQLPSQLLPFYPSCQDQNIFTKLLFEANLIQKYGFHSEKRLSRAILINLTKLPHIEMLLQATCRYCVDIHLLRCCSVAIGEGTGGTQMDDNPQDNALTTALDNNTLQYCTCTKTSHMLFKSQLIAIITVIKRSICETNTGLLHDYNETKEASANMMATLAQMEGKTIAQIYQAYVPDDLVVRERDERGN